VKKKRIIANRLASEPSIGDTSTNPKTKENINIMYKKDEVLTSSTTTFLLQGHNNKI